MKKHILSIGWASADISTEKPINLLGQFYMRISTGVLDPITEHFWNLHSKGRVPRAH